MGENNKVIDVVEPATEESLMAVEYKNLLATFDHLGVKDAWKPGSKKADMVKNALEKLNVVKAFTNAGKSDKEIKEALDNIDENKAKIKAAEDLKAAEEEEVKQTKVVKSLEDMELSKEEIEKNLELIGRNLKGGVPKQRAVLLNKKNILLKMLAKHLD